MLLCSTLKKDSMRSLIKNDQKYIDYVSVNFQYEDKE